MRNNIFVKNASGPNSNGMSLTFLMEGYSDSRPQSLNVENNIFVTFVKTYDGFHANYPLSFFYPNIRSDSKAWPSAIPTPVFKNAFVGNCAPGDGDPQDYRGGITVIESFSELTRVFGLVTKVSADEATLAPIYGNYMPEVGTPAYTNRYGVRLLRTLGTVGAED